MADMRIDFMFDEEKVNKSGFCMDDILHTLKKAFAEYDLPCISEGPVISFSDKGRKDDFAHLWIIIYGLSRMEWFLEMASSCIWTCNGKQEDVLKSALKKK